MYIEYLKWTIIIALIPTLLNFKNSLYATNISGINIVANTLFLFAWLLYGFYNGNKKIKEFIRFLIVYSILSIVLTLINSLINISILYVFVVYTSLTPMYGLYYYISSLNINDPLSYCLLILCMSLIPMIGYIVGSNIKNNINDYL